MPTWIILAITLYIAPCQSGEAVLVKSDGSPSSDGVGMVRICEAGQRGTICDDGHWDYLDAAVVCKQAGYSQFGIMHHVKLPSLLFSFAP